MGTVPRNTEEDKNENIDKRSRKNVSLLTQITQEKTGVKKRNDDGGGLMTGYTRNHERNPIGSLGESELDAQTRRTLNNTTSDPATEVASWLQNPRRNITRKTRHRNTGEENRTQRREPRRRGTNEESLQAGRKGLQKQIK